MENSTGAVGGDATAGSTATGAESTDEQSSVTQESAAGDESTTQTTDTDADVELEAQAQAEAESQAAKQTPGDKSTETAKDETAEAQAKEGEEQTDATKTSKKEAVVEQRKQIDVLEGQIKPLRELETKVLEIGGLPVLEMARPLVDAVLNPEATATEIVSALAEVAPHHDAQSLAWGIVDENQAAVAEHFFGEGMTPEILEKLADKYQAGEITLDDAEGEEEDDVFLTPRQKADRERAKAATAREAAATKAEREAIETKLQTERQATSETIAKLCSSTIETVLGPVAAKADDTPEVKSLKEVINKSVNAILMVELQGDPTWQRVQGLIQKNGLKAAESLAQGRLSITIRDKAAQVFQSLQPLIPATVERLQKQAQQIKEVRKDPTGATTQGDATRKKEISAKDPNWRQELDKEFEGKIANLGRVRARDERGQFL